MSVSGYRSMLIKARQTEAKVGLRTIEAFFNTRKVESGGGYVLGSVHFITTDNYTSATSCINTNSEIPFKIRNCTHARYFYNMYSNASISARIAAFEGGTGCNPLAMTGLPSGCTPNSTTRRVAPGCNVLGSLDTQIIELQVLEDTPATVWGTIDASHRCS